MKKSDIMDYMIVEIGYEDGRYIVKIGRAHV